MMRIRARTEQGSHRIFNGETLGCLARIYLLTSLLALRDRYQICDILMNPFYSSFLLPPSSGRKIMPSGLHNQDQAGAPRAN